MSFWKVTRKRSVRLNKAYFALGVGMSIYGVILSNLTTFIPSEFGNLPNTTDILNIFPFLSVALLSLSTLLFSLPVVMLFVYDKNNGVLEYLLSTGLDQLDIFKGYVKAALALAIYILTFAIILNTIIGSLIGTSLSFLAIMAVLIFVIGISEVFLVTVAMMAFSSLQKTPMGANQPMGIVIGIAPMFPALILPLLFPIYAIVIDSFIAAITLFASLALLMLVRRLIKREKLLP